MKETYSHEFNFWQKILQKMFGLWRINSGSFDFKWGCFAPQWGFEIVLNRGGYFDQHYAINICLLWGWWHIKLPFKTNIPESCDTPRYGVQIHSNDIWIHLGGKMNDMEQCDSKMISWSFPWFSWVFDHHKFMDASGVWIDGGYQNKDKAYSEKHPYQYPLSSGKLQKVTAECVKEKRQWHRKWFPFAKKISTQIDVSFDGEIGEESGSWKGGCVGCGYDLLHDESMLDCLRRMENERKF